MVVVVVVVVVVNNTFNIVLVLSRRSLYIMLLYQFIFQELLVALSLDLFQSLSLTQMHS